MPKSKVRKKPVYTPPPRSVRRKTSPRWLPVTMVAFFLVGLFFIVQYYATNGGMVGLSVLTYWNMVIGFVLIVGGVVLATQWR